MIARTIAPLLSGKIEPIYHFCFAPWDRSIPWDTRIAKLPKEETAMAHRWQMRLQSLNQVSYYLDGSQMPKSTGIGVGLAGYKCASRPFIRLARNIGPHQIVYNGELEGVALACEDATKLGPNRDIRVYVDNQAAIYRLARPSDNPGQIQQIRAVAAATKIAQNGSTLAIEWVPGHQDIDGNEEADKLAKLGSKSLLTT